MNSLFGYKIIFLCILRLLIFFLSFFGFYKYFSRIYFIYILLPLHDWIVIANVFRHLRLLIPTPRMTSKIFLSRVTSGPWCKVIYFQTVRPQFDNSTSFNYLNNNFQEAYKGKGSSPCRIYFSCKRIWNLLFLFNLQ